MENSPNTGAEMGILDHLGELRKRLLWIFFGILVGMIISGFYTNFIVEQILLRPAIQAKIELQNLDPFGQFFLYFQVTIISGLILSIPNVFYQLWKFISPALHQHEKKYVTSIVSFASLCFLSGIAFAYFVMIPMSLGVAATFGTTAIKNQFSLDLYISIIFSILLAAGVIFELPMISFFLSKLGFLTPEFMKKYRKHAVVVILILAAFLTPGTDPVSQIVLAVPLFVLYEISIYISRISVKKDV